MLTDLITIAAYMFIPVAAEAAAFVVCFCVVLILIEAMDSVLTNLRAG